MEIRGDGVLAIGEAGFSVDGAVVGTSVVTVDSVRYVFITGAFSFLSCRWFTRIGYTAIASERIRVAGSAVRRVG